MNRDGVTFKTEGIKDNDRERERERERDNEEERRKISN